MIDSELKKHIAFAINNLYGQQILPDHLAVEPTKDDFKGDFTFVVFPFLKQSKKGPEQTATDIGEYLLKEFSIVSGYNVIKGFLNIELSGRFWFDFLIHNHNLNTFGFTPVEGSSRVLVEYSSPNTNKPLHLGHIRNNLLGYSVAELLKANGHNVFTCNLINDRGIHICKSMLAWMKAGMKDTPENTGKKGDKLVGDFYVAFDKQYKAEIKALIENGMAQEEAEKNAPSMLEAQDLLRKWEAGDAETISIWKKMNGWVYDGFDVTYKKLGVSFDKYYYESETYLLGKDMVKEGLDKGVFFTKENGSVWVDLTADGLDQKLLLRADGTSVYITQDIGTAELKYKEFACSKSIYVVGNEQDYHFKVLQLVMQKLGKPYASGIYHLSYGMVELPHGKMKSREGTVVDADDLIDEMITTATETTAALGKTEGLTETELKELNETIALGALKYFILKVDPRKKMLFNPQESIDFHGNTGPFIQYTHARIRSVLRNAGQVNADALDMKAVNLHEPEKKLLELLYRYPAAIKDAGQQMSPGVLANYAYEVAKAYNHFYHELSILKESNTHQRLFRIMLCTLTAHVIKSAFAILGIQVPERM
jgi:arginyl-tRNA synthetase